MLKTSLVFFGNERLATGVTTEVPVVKALLSSGYKISAIVSSYDRTLSRDSRPLEIANVAKQYKIPLLLPGKLSDVHDQLVSYGAPAAVLIAFGKIVPQSIISLFPKGIINIHPSLLPLGRGPTPIEQVILSGAEKTGVSLMQLTKEMDEGPVYAQETAKLSGSETKQELADKLISIGAKLLIEKLPGILSGELVAKPQDNTKATYSSLVSKQDGKIDWSKPAKQIEKEIRAYANWPKSYTKLAGIDVIITKACAEDSRNGQPPLASKPGEVILSDTRELCITTGEGIIVVERLKPAGKPEMPVMAFLAGYKNKMAHL